MALIYKFTFLKFPFKGVSACVYIISFLTPIRGTIPSTLFDTIDVKDKRIIKVLINLFVK